MCGCGSPTINGTFGYRWQPNDNPTIYPLNPPKISEGDALLFDEPGRCTKRLDSHSYHYRVVKRQGRLWLLVAHGSGQEEFNLHAEQSFADTLANLDTNQRYFVCNTIYQTAADAADKARKSENLRWRQAAAEKRIKTRKVRGCDSYKVWIE